MTKPTYIITHRNLMVLFQIFEDAINDSIKSQKRCINEKDICWYEAQENTLKWAVRYINLCKSEKL